MTTTTIPALTVWQPWASLVAVGANRYETRSWPAPQTLQPGDLLAIHAAARRPSLGLDAMHWNAALADAQERMGGLLPEFTVIRGAIR